MRAAFLVLNLCRPCLTSNASLLQDHETEVRAATIKDISSFVDLVGPPTFASEVMPYVLALLQDVNLVRILEACRAPDLNSYNCFISTAELSDRLTEVFIAGVMSGFTTHGVVAEGSRCRCLRVYKIIKFTFEGPGNIGGNLSAELNITGAPCRECAIPVACAVFFVSTNDSSYSRPCYRTLREGDAQECGPEMLKFGRSDSPISAVCASVREGDFVRIWAKNQSKFCT